METNQGIEEHFGQVKEILSDMGLAIVKEDAADHLVIVDDPERGVTHLVIDCEDELLILAQHILDLPEDADAAVLRRLLQMNEGLVHGAFTLDASGRRVIFRDTLRLATLDPEELAGSINALTLGLAEFGEELIGFTAPAHA